MGWSMTELETHFAAILGADQGRNFQGPKRGLEDIFTVRGDIGRFSLNYGLDRVLNLL